MSLPLVTLTEIKSYIGLVGTADDVLIASIASNATNVAERHTGRVLAVSSNVTRYYSTDGNRSMLVHDRPFSDPARTVTLNGATLTEGTNVWFLPDRRGDGTVTTTIQLAPFDTTQQDWYLREPQWFDRNLDRSVIGAGGMPNDLRIQGVEGHPAITGDTRMALLELCAWLYFRAKSGASGVAAVATDLDISSLPTTYREWVDLWRVRAAVALI